MSHSNISIFIPHVGCPNMCSFCNQNVISGSVEVPNSAQVREICSQAMEQIKDKSNTEIAFFGGSFTAIPQYYMLELLESTKEFIGKDKFSGIRISTRPDSINTEVLKTLKKYNVTSIELGAQSMVDNVLKANDRGHTSEDVFKASELIKSMRFELGLQIMIGLYQSTFENELETYQKVLYIKPDTVRIYPVAVLENTRLAQLYKDGKYKLFSFDDVVKLSADMLIGFMENNIEVIRCGLHSSEIVEKEIVTGFYHQAFKELCENNIYRRKIEEIINQNPNQELYKIAVNSKCISKATGHKKSNFEYFRKKHINIKIVSDDKIQKYECEYRG